MENNCVYIKQLCFLKLYFGFEIALENCLMSYSLG